MYYQQFDIHYSHISSSTKVVMFCYQPMFTNFFSAFTCMNFKSIVTLIGDISLKFLRLRYHLTGLYTTRYNEKTHRIFG